MAGGWAGCMQVGGAVNTARPCRWAGPHNFERWASSSYITIVLTASLGSIHASDVRTILNHTVKFSLLLRLDSRFCLFGYFVLFDFLRSL